MKYGDVVEVDVGGAGADVQAGDVLARREAAANLCVGDEPPLVTVYFQAYNHLEDQTKMALHSLLAYTRNVDHELLLVDNGSTDGTLDFFCSIDHPHKRIFHVRENRGALFGYLAAKGAAGNEFIRGKYFAAIPSDVVVTKDWLKNLVTCMESDPRIGMVVPAANYTSYYQQVKLEFSTYGEMQKAAAAYNVSDPKKWEERLRLIPTASLIRSSLRKMYEADYGFFYNFADDDLSFTYRRLGYRLMFCRDTFVYHAPGTAMSEEAYQTDLREGRETFRRKYFGVDAWTDTRLDDELCRKCLDPSTPREDHRILGIDVRCGANLLHFKNCLRAYDLGRATLSAFVQDAKYWVDLKTICSGEVFCQPLRDLEAALEGHTYDYIILGMPLADYEDPKALLDIMRDHLSIGGRMAGRMEEDGEVFSLERYE